MKRFWSKVDKSKECWLWTGYKGSGGYGRFGANKKVGYAHRIAYELVKGPIPKGLELDHLCRNPACVNPSHLEPVTHKENMERGTHATKTHCINGHKFTPRNTYTPPSKPGTRECRTCRAARRQR